MKKVEGKGMDGLRGGIRGPGGTNGPQGPPNAKSERGEGQVDG